MIGIAAARIVISLYTGDSCYRGRRSGLALSRRHLGPARCEHRPSTPMAGRSVTSRSDIGHQMRHDGRRRAAGLVALRCPMMTNAGGSSASLVEYPDAWHPPAGQWDCAWRVPTHSGHRRLFQGCGPTGAGDRAPLSGRPHSRQGAVSTGAPPSEKKPPRSPSKTSSSSQFPLIRAKSRSSGDVDRSWAALLPAKTARNCLGIQFNPRRSPTVPVAVTSLHAVMGKRI